MSLILAVTIVALALVVLPCFAQEDFSKLEKQGDVSSLNTTPPPDSSWVFLDVPLGKYHLDTGLQLEQMNPNKLSATENEKSIEQKALTLQFSIKW